MNMVLDSEKNRHMDNGHGLWPTICAQEETDSSSILETKVMAQDHKLFYVPEAQFMVV
jgi:hypothetical protein